MQETNQTRRTTNQKGFVPALLLAAIAVLVTGGIGWSIYAGKKAQATSQAQAVSQASAAMTPTPPKVDPYAGWKTYCDDVAKACFKYPANWSIRTMNHKGTEGMVMILNQSGEMAGSYDESRPVGGSFPLDYIASLDDLSTPNANYKVVGEVYPSPKSFYPAYDVLDKSVTTRLAVGQQDASLAGDQKGRWGHLTMLPYVYHLTADQAKAWFKTDDAKTSLLIAKSFYLQD